MVPLRIIWHHSADSSAAHQFDKINLYHKSQGFSLSSLGFFVGYHWLIEPDGTVKQSRKEDEIGMHDAGENSNSIGICLAGDFNTGLPSEKQSASAALLVKQIRERWNIPITRIEPHRWDDATECPGKLLPDDWLTTQFLTRSTNIYERSFHWLGKYLKLI